MRQSDFRNLRIKYKPVHEISLKGFGNYLIKPIGKATVHLEIQNVSTNIEVLIVQDNLLKYPVLLGHNFTEQNDIVLIKTDKELILHKKKCCEIGGAKIKLIVSQNLIFDTIASMQCSPNRIRKKIYRLM